MAKSKTEGDVEIPTLEQLEGYIQRFEAAAEATQAAVEGAEAHAKRAEDAAAAATAAAAAAKRGVAAPSRSADPLPKPTKKVDFRHVDEETGIASRMTGTWPALRVEVESYED